MLAKSGHTGIHDEVQQAGRRIPGDRVLRARHDVFYTGDTFDSDEAVRLGLVDKVLPKQELQAGVMKIAKRMSRVSLDCLKWNKRAINQTFETMGLRTAIQYGSEASAIMDATGSPEASRFEEIRRGEGLQAALAWRTAQFAPYE
jgi:enoyl-CoA hydratase/carnithine racemase